MAERNGTGAALLLLERVRCLECGAIYSKPAGGGTSCSNPGCPHCGYVGWAATSLLTDPLPLPLPLPRSRSGADLPRRRLA
jgi:hypothetical protein